jgi:hypothetical protein
VSIETLMILTGTKSEYGLFGSGMFVIRYDGCILATVHRISCIRGETSHLVDVFYARFADHAGSKHSVLSGESC